VGREPYGLNKMKIKKILSNGALSSILVVIMLASSIVGLPKLKENNNIDIFFDGSSEITQSYQDIEEKFGSRETLVLIAKSKSGSIVDNLSALEALTSELDKTKLVINTFSLTEENAVRNILGKIDVTPLKELDKDEIRRYLEKDKKIGDRYVSEDYSYTIIYSDIDIKNYDGSEISGLMLDVNKIIEKHSDKFEIFKLGTTTLSSEFKVQTEQALGEILPIAFILMMLLVYVCLKSVLMSVFMLVVTIVSVVISLGLGAFLGFELTPVASYSPIIILTITVASCMHYFISFKAMELEGKEDCVQASIYKNIVPVFLSNITTIIGFLSLNVSNSKPFIDMGNFVSIGIVASFFATISILPIFLKTIRSKTISSTLFLTRFHYWNQYVVNNKLIVLVLPLTVLMAVFSIGNKFEDNVYKYFEKGTDIEEALSVQNDVFSGVKTIEIGFSSQEYTISDTKYYNLLKSFDQWLLTQDEVVRTVGVVDIIDKVDSVIGNDRKDISSRTISQYLLLYESSLPSDESLNWMVTNDQKSTLVKLYIKDMTTKEIIDFSNKVSSWVNSNTDDSIGFSIAGYDLVFSNMSIENSKLILMGSLLVISLITILFLVLFKDPLVSIICMVFNLLPGLAALGAWYFIDGTLSLSVCIVIAITIGIVVDDTVHIVYSMISYKDEGKTEDDVVKQVLNSTGMAVTLSSLILVITFLLISMASFYPMYSLGIVSAITVTIAWAIDMFVLPKAIAKVLKLKSEMTGLEYKHE